VVALGRAEHKSTQFRHKSAEFTMVKKTIAHGISNMEIHLKIGEYKEVRLERIQLLLLLLGASIRLRSTHKTNG